MGFCGEMAAIFGVTRDQGEGRKHVIRLPCVGERERVRVVQVVAAIDTLSLAHCYFLCDKGLHLSTWPFCDSNCFSNRTVVMNRIFFLH